MVRRGMGCMFRAGRQCNPHARVSVTGLTNARCAKRHTHLLIRGVDFFFCILFCITYTLFATQPIPTYTYTLFLARTSSSLRLKSSIALRSCWISSSRAPSWRLCEYGALDSPKADSPSCRSSLRLLAELISAAPAWKPAPPPSPNRPPAKRPDHSGNRSGLRLNGLNPNGFFLVETFGPHAV